MTDNTIRPGDWVMVVRPAPCCGDTESVMNIFQVTELKNIAYRCLACGALIKTTTTARTGYVLPDGRHYGHLLSRLQKLPPVTEESPEQMEVGVDSTALIQENKCYSD